MTTITSIDDLSEALVKLIDDNLGGISEPIREALPGAADIYIKHAQEQTKKVLKNTPHESEEKHFNDSWDSYKKGKYKNSIFVGNSRKFKDKDGREGIPAINIFEYGTSRGLPVKPILGPAMDSAAEEILDYIAKTIEKEL